MDITLRQHEDGSYVLVIGDREVRREVDITNIIRDIFLIKLNDLQTKIRLEERYRSWVTDRSLKQEKLLSTIRSRYVTMSKMLTYTNGAIDDVVDEWKEGDIKGGTVRELIKVKSQNEHFLKHDDTLRKLDED